MPKLKTRKAAAKRFEVTGSGKLRCRRAGKNHLLEHKSTALKSKMSQKKLVDTTDQDRVHGMLPYI